MPAAFARILLIPLVAHSFATERRKAQAAWTPSPKTQFQVMQFPAAPPGVFC
jgi:hypothetical protein